VDTVADTFVGRLGLPRNHRVLLVGIIPSFVAIKLLLLILWVVVFVLGVIFFDPERLLEVIQLVRRQVVNPIDDLGPNTFHGIDVPHVSGVDSVQVSHVLPFFLP